jgi:trehalose 6-phosphate synthase/phosphatase
MNRVMIVSNRLPVTVSRRDGEIKVERSSGGLATGLRSSYEKSGGLWVGWPGAIGERTEAEEAQLRQLFEGLRVAPVDLTDEEVSRYYEGYCNGLLWPLFHSFIGLLPMEVPDFPVYRAVNEKFADVVAQRYQPGDRIWIHDYQLMLLPRLLRERLPEASIGFFLHIPFPPPDTFRTLPARASLLDGLLAADLVGFHTASYMRNFSSSALHILGVTVDVDRVTWQGRVSNLGVFPMGVDAAAFQERSRSPEVQSHAVEFRGRRGERLLVGIDRLDYTKGIPRRLLAFERLLKDHPELHGHIRLVQVAVPSRTGVDAYAEFRNQVDALVGRINGQFGSPDWVPVYYIYRGLTEDHVTALYRAADVMLVTPIRDGMNLIAKEFIAARSDNLGVLVLSEFAGAAAELAEAIHVNPYDTEGMAQAFARALEMPEAEQRTRMATLRQRVFSYDVHWWASTFLQEQERFSRQVDHRPIKYSSNEEIALALQTLQDAPELLLLLDYDGTLVPIADTPDLARPDAELFDLLFRLSRRPRTHVHIVSGRGRDVLDAWLGMLPIGLHAEHGFWSRRGGTSWESLAQVPDTWRIRALEILQDFAARTPGSLVEQKQSSLAWHFRMADQEYGAFQANELRVHLTSLLSNAPVEVLAGDKVIELRPFGANKGHVASALLRDASPELISAAFGDDKTDEDLFAALPVSGLSFHVGPAPSRARVRLRAVSDVRAMLRQLSAPGRTSLSPGLAGAPGSNDGRQRVRFTPPRPVGSGRSRRPARRARRRRRSARCGRSSPGRASRRRSAGGRRGRRAGRRRASPRGAAGSAPRSSAPGRGGRRNRGG